MLKLVSSELRESASVRPPTSTDGQTNYAWNQIWFVKKRVHMRNPTPAHSWNPAPGRKLTEHRLTKGSAWETEWLLLFRYCLHSVWSTSCFWSTYASGRIENVAVKHHIKWVVFNCKLTQTHHSRGFTKTRKLDQSYSFIPLMGGMKTLLCCGKISNNHRSFCVILSN